MIPNWTHFGVQHAVVEVWQHKNPDDESEVIYNAFITMFLNDTPVTNDGNERVISLQSDVFDEDRYECAAECARQVVELFGRVSRMVYIFNEDSEIIEEYELDESAFLDDGVELYDETSNEPEFDQMDNVIPMIPKNRTLH